MHLFNRNGNIKLIALEFQIIVNITLFIIKGGAHLIYKIIGMKPRRVELTGLFLFSFSK